MMKFGPLQPDLPATNNPGLVAARNVYPQATGYGPVRGFAAVDGGELGAECLGAAAFRSAANTTALFAGTEANLYRFRAGGFAEVGSGYSTDEDWDFAQFGSLVIATNGVDTPQSYDLTTETAFTPLGGSPPTMRMLAVVRDFLVGGVIDGDYSQMQWSGINDPTFWAAGGGKQCDNQIFPDGGKITGIAGGEYGIVFQERAIRQMVYSGGDTVFQFRQISANVGCVAPRSLIQYAGRCYFLSDQGFMVTDGSGAPEPFGDQRVDETFRAASSRLFYHRMSAAVDPINKRLIFTEPSSADPTRWWVYSIPLDRWTTVEQGADRVFSAYSADTTVEDLGEQFASVEDIDPADVDDAQWQGGEPALYVIDNAHTLGTMTGPNLEAVITTGEMQLVQGQRARLQRVAPYCDAEAPTLSVSGRVKLSDAATTTSYAGLNRRGEFPVRENWNYMQLSLTIPEGADWTFAQGLDVAAVPGGR